MNVLACDRWSRLVPAILAFAIGAIPIQAADNFIALKAERLFDGKSKAFLHNGVVLIQGDKIADVGSNLAIPSGAQVIDLGDATLAPGFMDAHTHLTLDYSGDYKSAGCTSWISTFQSKRSERQPSRALQSKRVSLPSVTWAADSSAAANLSMWRCVIRLIKA